MRAARAVTVAILFMAGAGTAAAQTSLFPSALEREALLVWLQRETDILPDQVVAVTPQALTSIVSLFPAGAGTGPRLVIRAEALSPEIQSSTGAMSWHVSLTADCQGRRIRLGETTGYSERNLLGTRRVLRAAETNWRTPEPGTAVEHAWRAACEPGFQGPFKSSAVRLAQVDRPAPATPTAAEPAAPVSAPTAVVPEPTSAPRREAPKVSAPVPPRPARAVAPASRASGLVAQLGSLASDASAKQLLASLSRRLGGRSTWVEKADVSGRTWYRAMAGGFADAGDAAQFCADLKAAGLSCFVRSGRPV